MSDVPPHELNPLVCRMLSAVALASRVDTTVIVWKMPDLAEGSCMLREGDTGRPADQMGEVFDCGPPDSEKDVCFVFPYGTNKRVSVVRFCKDLKPNEVTR